MTTPPASSPRANADSPPVNAGSGSTIAATARERAPVTLSSASPLPAGGRPAGWRILLVEDDDGDAVLVRELLADGLPGASTERVSTLADALLRAGEVECILLDVGLPDAGGTRGVEELTRAAPDAAVVVLTGADSERLGVASVIAGAQDYLVKGHVDDQLLARSIRYAIERQRVARLSRELFEAERRRAENVRVERALTPTPLIRSSQVDLALRYRARREGSELGGDFYDAVETSDRGMHALIGDVAGHGPDEAALAARLRSAWRALTLAGLDKLRVIETLDGFLRTEWDAITFATLCVLEVDYDRRRGALVLAGHPPPIMVGDRSRVVGNGRYGPLLGVLPEPLWHAVEFPFEPGSRLLLYTDGLIEGRSAPDAPTRLGIEALLPIIDDFHRLGATGEELLDGLLAEVHRRNGGPLPDDVALCLVTVADDGG